MARSQMNPYFLVPDHNLNPRTDEPWNALWRDDRPPIYIRHSAQANNAEWIVKVKDALTKLGENAIGRMLLEAIKQTGFPAGQERFVPTNFKVIIVEPEKAERKAELVSAKTPDPKQVLIQNFNNMQAAYEAATDPRNAVDTLSSLTRKGVSKEALTADVKAKAFQLFRALAAFNNLPALQAHKAEWKAVWDPLSRDQVTTYSQLGDVAHKISDLLKNLVPSSWAEAKVEALQYPAPWTEGAAEENTKNASAWNPIKEFAGPAIVYWYPSDAVYDVRGDVPSIAGGAKILVDTPFGKTESNGARPTWVSLGHELIHALHFIEGTNYSVPAGTDPDRTLAERCRMYFNNVDRVFEEWRTTGIHGALDPRRQVAGPTGNHPCVNERGTTPQEKYTNCAISENNMRAVAGIAPRTGYFMFTDPGTGEAVACRLDADDQAVPYSAVGGDVELEGGPPAADFEDVEGPLADGAFDGATCDAADGSGACPCCAAAAAALL